jgi:hypothetical protein
MDELGFIWDGTPPESSKAHLGGDPRHNRSIAAMLVYPALDIREAMILGGFNEDDEEMKVIMNPKYSWRTKFVYHKDAIAQMLQKYEQLKLSGEAPSYLFRPRIVQIEELVNTLKGDKDDRFEQVFGVQSNLLPQFLELAEERKSKGVAGKSRGRFKRSREEQLDDEFDEEQHVDDDNDDGGEEEEGQSEDVIDFQSHIDYERCLRQQNQS